MRLSRQFSVPRCRVLVVASIQIATMRASSGMRSRKWRRTLMLRGLRLRRVKPSRQAVVLKPSRQPIASTVAFRVQIASSVAAGLRTEKYDDSERGLHARYVATRLPT